MDHAFFQLTLASILLIAGATDLGSSKIPNWLTIPAMATGVLGHSWLNGLTGLVFSAKGLGLGLAMFLVLYVMGGMGAGDVKLLAAVGSFTGAEGVFSAGMIAMVLGGLYAISLMISHCGVRISLRQIATVLKSCVLMPGSLPSSTQGKALPQLRYALVIGLGTLMSQWIQIPVFTF